MVDAQDGNSFNMKQFLEYRDFREQNHALKDQFHIDETVEFGFFSEKFVFDYQNNLFCMDKGLDRTIFHGSELESFLISEDGARCWRAAPGAISATRAPSPSASMTCCPR